MTHPDTRPSTIRFGLPRFRRPHPDPFALIAFAGALMVAGAFALAIARPDSENASLGIAGGAQPGFAAPVAIPANGEYVRSRVLPSGDLAVDHWIRSTHLIWQLTLSVPPALRTGATSVQASRIKVAGDGVTQFGPTTVTARESYHPQGATTLHVSYVLTGAVMHTGSAQGRALLRTTSLDLAYTRDRVPRVVSLSGTRVLAVACLPPGGEDTSSARPCGTAQGRDWRVSLDANARRYDVLAQLDLT